MQKTKQTELDLPLLFDPGDSWAYGASTRVLGHLVEAISGQKIDAFLESRILSPLGMHDTSYLCRRRSTARVVASEQARRRWQVHRAARAGDDPCDGARRRRPVWHAERLRPVPAHAAQSRHVERQASPQREVRANVFESHTGNVVVKEQLSANQPLSRNFPVGAGKDKWGLGFQLAADKQPNRRSPGSGTWAGIFNTHFFIDPSREIGVVVMMQTLPFYDEASMKVYVDVEEAVYQKSEIIRTVAPSQPVDDLTAGRAALDAGAWQDAQRAFERLLADRRNAGGARRPRPGRLVAQPRRGGVRFARARVSRLSSARRSAVGGACRGLARLGQRRVPR